MTQVPRYRHACKGCGKNMLSNPKCGLCGDCAHKHSRGRDHSIAEATRAIRELEMQLIVLDHKDFFTLEDQAELARLRGLLLARYRHGWEVVIGRKVVDLALATKPTAKKMNGVNKS